MYRYAQICIQICTDMHRYAQICDPDMHRYAQKCTDLHRKPSQTGVEKEGNPVELNVQ
jgi:hypothetical protein